MMTMPAQSTISVAQEDVLEKLWSVSTTEMHARPKCDTVYRKLRIVFSTRTPVMTEPFAQQETPAPEAHAAGTPWNVKKTRPVPCTRAMHYPVPRYPVGSGSL